MKTTFRVSRNYPKILRNRKRRIQRRLAPRNWEAREQPMMRGSNIHYELSDKTRATVYGGMGAVHRMVQRLGWVEPIDQNLELLKVHLPCHESDHVRNIAGNVLVGGERLEDIELRRPDESFLDGVGAQRIPDPTTAGETSPGALASSSLPSCRNALTGRGRGCGKSNGWNFGVSCTRSSCCRFRSSGPGARLCIGG